MSAVTTSENVGLVELSDGEVDQVNAAFLPLLLAAAELAPAFLIGAAVGVGVGVAVKYALS
jgi:hypothetical protein